MTIDIAAAWAREAALLRPTVLTPALLDGLAPDRERRWVPEALLPLHGGPLYNDLTADQRRFYNQAYARQLLAEFIWVERTLIVAPVRRLALAGDAAIVRDSFVVDETHHIASFARLAASAADGRGPARPFSPPWPLRALARLAAAAPVGLHFWTAVVAAFERYAVDIGQRFNTDVEVDPAFRAVFVAHARDEARHCRLDDLLAAHLGAAAGPALTTVNGALARRYLARYFSVAWGLDGPIDALVAADPTLAARRAALVAESQSMRRAQNNIAVTA
ncbi:MAG: diiron oxygenase [Rhodospirillaceae bacterium]|nr:diiron oxygenase [Rhodospirillaceae bacterium]